MLWEIDIHPRSGNPNRVALRAKADICDLLGNRDGEAAAAQPIEVAAARSFLLQGESLTEEAVQRLANELLSDRVVETVVVAKVGDEKLACSPSDSCEKAPALVHVLPKQGVMDPVAMSAITAIADSLDGSGIQCDAVRTLRKFWITGVSPNRIADLCDSVLANEAIEQVVLGPLTLTQLDVGSDFDFSIASVSIAELNDEELMQLSLKGQLYLQLPEMQTIQAYFKKLDRDPTDIELETIAQTWSEHCSHKTLAGRIAYRDENGERHFENMLKETIFAATQTIRKQLGEEDWCVSVFKDNAGIIRFDDTNNLAFKVETHNHPSALEPYGGANTGIGGVIRDIHGTGLGAKPFASTDIFCFAPPNRPATDATGKSTLPAGVLHPRRVMRGVVEGVRDYGNRMGIPTVNGAIYFDERYLGNPLVYCGSVGIIPHDKSFGDPKPGDRIVAIGGRTGRDGIHGATFSSAELTSESEELSGGAVQIGNAVEEKKVQDVLLEARDRGLYSAVTDCGAGGFSSAVGEMGEEIGAEVWLDRAPLKYDGLTYTEIWISEAQERMVFAVPEENVEAMISLCQSESVEAFVLGEFVPTGRLELKYNGKTVGDIPMDFLHNGRPPVVRKAVYKAAEKQNATAENSNSIRKERKEISHAEALLAILGSLNVASKEWVIRQYDHEVQGGSVVKPLVGVQSDGPSDAAVVRPLLESKRAAVLACGMNPHYGDLDTYHMAASAIDEAMRNCVAVGADPSRIALLDNFCWGDCEKEATLGSLVRAAIACYDVAVALGTPFVSGKDSLNNEFSYVEEATGERKTIAIPATLLISALGQMDDASKCVTMDLKAAGNSLYLVGQTKNELGGSHYHIVIDAKHGNVPTVDTAIAKQTFAAIHQSIMHGLVRSCHDLSEGGLAVAAAEMCFAGGLGANINVAAMPHNENAASPEVLLFSESNTRFLCEVPTEHAGAFEAALGDIPCAKIGEVSAEPMLQIRSSDFENKTTLLEADIEQLKAAWKKPLAW